MNRLSKQEGYFYLRKVYRLLDDERIKVFFRKMPQTAGLVVFADRTIFLNPEHEILPVIIHECLHLLYRDWTEERVVLMTKKISSVMSKAQMNHLINRLTMALNRSFYGSNSNGKAS